MGNSFSWTAGGSGSWDIAGNWLDLTTLATAEAAPGATDTATINGPDTGAAITVGGPASVAGLTVNFAVDLAGDLAVDELTVAQPPSSFTPGTTTSDVTLSGSLVASRVSIGSLYLVPGFSSQIVNEGTVAVPSGAALTAGTVAVNAGALQEAGGALDIEGILTLGSLLISIRAPVVRQTSGVLDVLNHAHARLDGLNIMDGSVSLDATSTLEIGNAGNAAAGTITIDQGAALFTISPLRSIGTVSIAGPVLNNGTMSVLTASDLSDVMNNGSIEFDGTTFSNSVNDGSITADGGTLSTISGPGSDQRRGFGHHRPRCRQHRRSASSGRGTDSRTRCRNTDRHQRHAAGLRLCQRQFDNLAGCHCRQRPLHTNEHQIGSFDAGQRRLTRRQPFPAGHLYRRPVRAEHRQQRKHRYAALLRRRDTHPDPPRRSKGGAHGRRR